MKRRRGHGEREAREKQKAKGGHEGERRGRGTNRVGVGSLLSLDQAAVLIQRRVGLFKDGVEDVDDGAPSQVDVVGVGEARRRQGAGGSSRAKQTVGDGEEARRAVVELPGDAGVDGPLEGEVFGRQPVDRLDGRHEALLDRLLDGRKVGRWVHGGGGRRCWPRPRARRRGAGGRLEEESADAGEVEAEAEVEVEVEDEVEVEVKPFRPPSRLDFFFLPSSPAPGLNCCTAVDRALQAPYRTPLKTPLPSGPFARHRPPQSQGRPPPREASSGARLIVASNKWAPTAGIPTSAPRPGPIPIYPFPTIRFLAAGQLPSPKV